MTDVHRALIPEATHRLEERETGKLPGPLPGSEIRQLLSDVEPFFYRQPLVYLDIGAHKGDVFREVYTSPLRLRTAHLVEPNPASFALLETTVRELGAEKIATCHNFAVAAEAQRLRMHDANDMTKVIGPVDGAVATEARSFEVEATTLDTLVQTLQLEHVSILKIDVEGYEREVFAGAAQVLAAQVIDVIYVEAGIDPQNAQQTYYREIEDTLRQYGYRLFRIYEQMNEWLQDSPILRRINLAFFSEKFASRSPYMLSHKLFSAESECTSLRRALKAQQALVSSAQKEIQDKDLGLARAQEEMQDKERALARVQAELREKELTLAGVREEVIALREANNSQQVQAEILAAVKGLATRLASQEQRRVDAQLRRDQAFASAQEQIKVLSAQIAGLEKQLKARAAKINELTQVLEETRRKLRALLKSRSWRLTGPLRSMVRIVRGKG